MQSLKQQASIPWTVTQRKSSAVMWASFLNETVTDDSLGVANIIMSDGKNDHGIFKTAFKCAPLRLKWYRMSIWGFANAILDQHFYNFNSTSSGYLSASPQHTIELTEHYLPHATLELGSCFKWASRIASLIWSQILSGKQAEKLFIHL